MRGDGDGWVVSHAGTHHWGRYGAAGLLLRAPLGDGTLCGTYVETDDRTGLAARVEPIRIGGRLSEIVPG